RQLGLPEQLIIDFSHGNCQKIYQRQIDVAKNIAKQLPVCFRISMLVFLSKSEQPKILLKSLISDDFILSHLVLTLLRSHCIDILK
ncbi:MAG: hypothetical protein ACTS85_04490, partial [Arsenophonus sp. NC-PG7-MAG3]